MRLFCKLVHKWGLFCVSEKRGAHGHGQGGVDVCVGTKSAAIIGGPIGMEDERETDWIEVNLDG